jgi:hypothetical protein
MTTRKTLKESVGDEKFGGMVERLKNTKFLTEIKRMLKEAKLDYDDVTAVNTIYEQILISCEPNLTDELALKVLTDKEVEIFEVSLAATATALGSGGAGKYTNAGPTNIEVPITCSRDYGLNPTWTRQFIERASWDAMSWAIQESGKAITKERMDFMIDIYLVDFGQKVTGEHDHLDYDDFVDAIGEAEVHDSHPDTLLCSPRDYTNLLKDEQFTSLIYAGDDSTMRTGIVKTTLGVTVVRTSRMPEYMALLLEKQKAGALVIRRDVTVEPYERPEDDEYGFVEHNRYGFDSLMPCAITLISNC